MQYDTSKTDHDELESLRDKFLAGRATQTTQKAAQATDSTGANAKDDAASPSVAPGAAEAGEPGKAEKSPEPLEGMTEEIDLASIAEFVRAKGAAVEDSASASDRGRHSEGRPPASPEPPRQADYHTGPQPISGAQQGSAPTKAPAPASPHPSPPAPSTTATPRPGGGQDKHPGPTGQGGAPTPPESSPWATDPFPPPPPQWTRRPQQSTPPPPAPRAPAPATGQDRSRPAPPVGPPAIPGISAPSVTNHAPTPAPAPAAENGTERRTRPATGPQAQPAHDYGGAPAGGPGPVSQEKLPREVTDYIRRLESRSGVQPDAQWFAEPTSPPAQARRESIETTEARFVEERATHGAERDFIVQSGRREGPQQGWRSAVSRIGVPIGKSATELDYDHDIAKINKRLRYRKTVGVVAFKGGVGKTSMTVSLASTVAAHRQDGAIVAIDTVARGSMTLRVKGVQPADGDVKAFAADQNLYSLSDVRAHLMSNTHRLSILGAHRDFVTSALTAQEYHRALEQLHRHHDIVFVDTEPSVATPAYESIIESLDALILIVNPTRDSAVPGRDVLPWLRTRGLTELASRTIVLLNHQSPAKPRMDQEVITHHFHHNEKVEVLAIPYDEHLSEAGPISLGLLNKNTRRQMVRAAAILLDKLPAN